MDVMGEVRTRLFGPAGRALLRSRLAYILVEAGLRLERVPPDRRHDRVAALFAVRQTGQAYLRRRPVVWTSAFVPSELIYILGKVPFLPEVAAAACAAMGHAPDMVQEAEKGGYASDLCTVHRCGLGLLHAGYLPAPDAIVVSSALCDGGRKFLAHAARQYGCPFYLLDVPYDDDPDTLDYLAAQLEEVAARIGPLPPQRLIERVFHLSNQARAEHLAINDLRQRQRGLLRGPEAVGYTSMLMMGFGSAGCRQFYRLFRRSLERRARAVREAEVQIKRPPRLLWLHFKPYYPNSVLPDLVSSGKAEIAVEEMNMVWWEELDPAWPWLSLARKMTSHPGWGPAQRRVERVLDLARRYQVDGAVHFSHWGCRQSTGAVRLLQDALRGEGIPLLNLEGDCVDHRNFLDGQARTRVEGFLELLEGC